MSPSVPPDSSESLCALLRKNDIQVTDSQKTRGYLAPGDARLSGIPDALFSMNFETLGDLLEALDVCTNQYWVRVRDTPIGGNVRERYEGRVIRHNVIEYLGCNGVLRPNTITAFLPHLRAMRERSSHPGCLVRFSEKGGFHLTSHKQRKEGGRRVRCLEHVAGCSLYSERERESEEDSDSQHHRPDSEW
ncbi:hypothetical protein KIPB_007956 [Kipferlia bialata]|uniref:Uncharacterized protein n=1 Tax=Kipferlia bialata TaxID=797122 RepID=A0A9K3GKF5_9EUKA|nr:hypothetical protein KIPB_007956 [Kipferlia bialata]|eukprot:g7956.t1